MFVFSWPLAVGCAVVLVLMGLFLYAVILPKIRAEYLEDVLPPAEAQLPGVKRVERGTVLQSVVGFATVRVTEECRVLGPIPKVRARRVIEIGGYVTSEQDARALSDLVVRYSAEL